MGLDREVNKPSTERNAVLVPNQHNLRNILITVTVLLLLVIMVLMARSQILTGIADHLIINDKLQPADAIFLLNSEFNTRPFRAAELYKQGLAPVIVIAQAEAPPVVGLGLVPNDTDISVGVLKKLGVPPGKIIVLPIPGGVTSTFDEAVAFRQYTEVKQMERVIVVTSAFHTRRAKWILDKTLAGLPVKLEMAAVPYAGFDQTNWWKNENGFFTLINEYIKLGFYYFKYR
jgi:uncharacterized SAM-binding protein YcdF (DUF218 family)